MSHGRLVRWAALGVGLLLCPLLSGCLVPLGAAWPSLPVIPPLQVNATGGQVHAFCVEAVTSHGSIDFSGENEYVLREVSVSPGGWVRPQVDVACDYGWCWHLIALGFVKVKHHTLMVRLYRPGCETVEVGAWSLAHEVKWTGVADLAGQEKAIDGLVSTRGANIWQEMAERRDEEEPPSPSDEGSREETPPPLGCEFLAAGSKSPEHRKALLFAATEYERLAKSSPDDAASRAVADRMRKKAAWLRALAEK
jgi:hypothetical protein